MKMPEEIKLPKFFDELIAKLLPAMTKDVAEGEIMPMAYIGSTETGKMALVGMSFKDEREKDACSQVMRRMAQEFNADFVVFISESWTIPQEYVEDFMQNRDKYPAVADHPHRKEIVMISIETKLTNYMGMSEITEDRKMIEPKFMEAKNYQGRFTHFLGPKIVAH